MSSSSAARALSPAPPAPTPPRRVRPARCAGFVGPAVESATPGARAATLASSRGGTDSSLAICRVLNGMWQTSGGWGRIDRADAVDAMLAYADAGLSTFDMADHCTVSLRHLREHLACMCIGLRFPRMNC